MENKEEFGNYVRTLTTSINSKKRAREGVPKEPEAKKQKVNHYVYILEEIGGNGTYVGETFDIQERLAKHNAGKGSQLTTGRKWKILHLLEGSTNKDNAIFLANSLKTSCKKLETALKHQRTTHRSDWGGILQEILAKKTWQHIKLVEL